MSDDPSSNRALKLTAQIVAAHVGHNRVTTDAVSGLITTVFRTLSRIDSPVSEPSAPTPAVPIRKSIFPDFVVCLEDGKKMKMLKRHLMTTYGMTPDQYREKWNLPSSYPMVAPNYALRRSSLAKSIGLGRKPQLADVTPPMATTTLAESPPAKVEPTAEAAVATLPKAGTAPVAATGRKSKKPAAAKAASSPAKGTGKKKGR